MDDPRSDFQSRVDAILEGVVRTFRRAIVFWDVDAGFVDVVVAVVVRTGSVFNRLNAAVTLVRLQLVM